MKNWISVLGVAFLISGIIVLAIASYYNFGTCPPLPKGGSCDNSVGITTVTVSITLILLGIGLFIVTIQKNGFRLKQNS